MIETIFVILLFTSEFISLIYTAERIKLYDFVKGKPLGDLTLKEQRAMQRLGLKVIYGMILLGFLVYGMFISHLRLYCGLSLIVIIINVFLTKSQAVINMSQRSRIIISGMISLTFMLIWLIPFLEILKVAF